MEQYEIDRIRRPVISSVNLKGFLSSLCAEVVAAGVNSGLSFAKSCRVVDGSLWGTLRFLPLLLLLPGSVEAQDYTYTTNSGEITITGYTGVGGAVVIPDTINGLPVTVIGANTFYKKTNVSSVTIPDNVTTIGIGAFYFCTGLASVTIGKSVVAIEDHAFYYCTGLASVMINDGVTSLGDSAFDHCTGLTNVVIPDSVTEIGIYAFASCSKLTSVKIPDSVTSIQNGAFRDCFKLASVLIGDGVTAIGTQAFYYCTSLRKITVGKSVASIGIYAFDGCTGLASVYFKANEPSLDGGSVFLGDDNATVYYLLDTTRLE